MLKWFSNYCKQHSLGLVGHKQSLVWEKTVLEHLHLQEGSSENHNHCNLQVAAALVAVVAAAEAGVVAEVVAVADTQLAAGCKPQVAADKGLSRAQR